MQTDSEAHSLLDANLNATLTPAISIVKPSGDTHTVSFSAANGFWIDLNLSLPFAALSALLQTFLQGKLLSITEGFLNQYAVLDGCQLYSDGQSGLVAEVPFSGSYSGTFYVTGIPVYQAPMQQIQLQNVAYDLKTKSLVLKGAKWLFGSLILDEIKKYTAVSLANFYVTLKKQLDDALNKQWATGIAGAGAVTEIVITKIAAQKENLVIQAQCRGDLQLRITEIELKL